MSEKKISALNNSQQDTNIDDDIETTTKPLVPNSSPLAIYDNKNSQWTFMRKSLFVLFLLNFCMLVIWNLQCYDYKIIKDLLRNYTNVNAYTIVSLILLIVIYVFSAVFQKFARLISFALCLLIFLILFYLVAFGLNYLDKIHHDTKDVLISSLVVFFSASTGTWIALLADKKEVNLSIAISASLVLQIIQELALTYIYKIHFMHMWKYFLFILSNVIMTTYYCLDLQMMITRRSHLYQTDFWYNGFIDIQTDMFFRFWKDIFTKNPYEEAVDTQAEL